MHLNYFSFVITFILAIYLCETAPVDGVDADTDIVVADSDNNGPTEEEIQVYSNPDEGGKWPWPFGGIFARGGGGWGGGYGYGGGYGGGYSTGISTSISTGMGGCGCGWKRDDGDYEDEEFIYFGAGIELDDQTDDPEDFADETDDPDNFSDDVLIDVSEPGTETKSRSNSKFKRGLGLLKGGLLGKLGWGSGLLGGHTSVSSGCCYQPVPVRVCSPCKLRKRYQKLKL